MSLINEAITSIVFHYTTLKGFSEMLKTNKIKATPAYLGAYGDRDNQSKESFYISTTTSSSFKEGYQNQQKLNVQLTLDGDKLNNNFKGKRVAYYSNDDRGKDRGRNNLGGADEMEDRIFLNNSEILFNKYVTKVVINHVDVGLDLTEFYGKVKKYLSKSNIEFKVNGFEFDDYIGDNYNTKTPEFNPNVIYVTMGLLHGLESIRQLKINFNKFEKDLKVYMIGEQGKAKTLALLNSIPKSNKYQDILADVVGIFKADDELRVKRLEIISVLRHFNQAIKENRSNEITEHILQEMSKIIKSSGSKTIIEYFTNLLSEYEKEMNSMKPLNEDLIEEGVSSLTYHFTSIPALYNMLKNNSIRASIAYHDEAETTNNMNNGFPFFISTTSSSSFENGYAKFGEMFGSDLCVRLTLDGNKIMNNYKVKRVSYSAHSDRMKDMRDKNKSHLDEMEDRILLKKPSIPFSKYVINCIIDVNRIEDEDNKNKNVFDLLASTMGKIGLEYGFIGYEPTTTHREINKQTNYDYSEELFGLVLGFYQEFLPNKLNYLDKELSGMFEEYGIEKETSINTDEYEIFKNIGQKLKSTDEPRKELINLRRVFIKTIDDYNRDNDIDVALVGLLGNAFNHMKFIKPNDMLLALEAKYVL